VSVPGGQPQRGRRAWNVLLVPEGEHTAEHTVHLSSRELRYWRFALTMVAVAVIATVVTLGYTIPRSLAYGQLLQENLELKGRLDGIDGKLGEVERILLRLRIYDAQLDSMSAPRGDHGGPLVDEALANHAPPLLTEGEDLEALLYELPLDGDPEDALVWSEEEGTRSASDWAADLDDRISNFLAKMASVEPDVNRLLQDVESANALQNALPHVWPAQGLLTSGYGFRRNPFGGRGWRLHTGIDIGGQRGYEIYASADGTVISAGWDGGLGKAVRLDHGFGLTTVYGHMSRPLVRDGQRVVAGQRIGLMGTTGHSTGPHLHFEVQIDGNSMDPFDYVKVPAEALVDGVTPPPLLRRFLPTP
jgi:murein DD-endopeptidase MepM/ murein hydrolase activator NlpD